MAFSFEKRLTLLAAALLFFGGCERHSTPVAQPRPYQVTIRQTTWNLELATTDMQRYRGLSGRTEIPKGTGMLFLYPSARQRDFCMRDCFVPIDIAYIDSNRRVVKTYTMQVEADRSGSIPYRSVAPAQFVLEVAGGALASAGVQVGDEVKFSDNIPDAAKAEVGP